MIARCGGAAQNEAQVNKPRCGTLPSAARCATATYEHMTVAMKMTHIRQSISCKLLPKAVCQYDSSAASELKYKGDSVVSSGELAHVLVQELQRKTNIGSIW